MGFSHEPPDLRWQRPPIRYDRYGPDHRFVSVYSVRSVFHRRPDPASVRNIANYSLRPFKVLLAAWYRAYEFGEPSMRTSSHSCLRQPIRICGPARVRQRKGAAAVEFAVVLPIILMLILGGCELSCAILVQASLQNAAREAAREAVLPSATLATTTQLFNDCANAGRLRNATMTATPDPAQAPTGTLITVTANAPFGDNDWLPTPRFLDGAVLSASVVMRKE
jgi:hypothetical protein